MTAHSGLRGPAARPEGAQAAYATDQAKRVVSISDSRQWMNLFSSYAESARMWLDQEERIPLGDGTSACAALTVALRCCERRLIQRTPA